MELRRQLVTGALPETQPQTAIVLSWILNFFLGMILATIPVLNGSGPFGIAIAARAMGGISSLMCAFGASFGYLLAFGFQEGIKSVAAVVLVFAAGFVFQDVKFAGKTAFMPAIAAFFTLLTNFLGYYTASTGSYLILPLIAQTILAFGAAYFFREAFQTVDPLTEAAELRRGISWMLLTACILMALSRATIMETVSFGRVCAILIVQAIAYRGGLMCGAVCGVMLGAAMDAACSQSVFYAMAYSLSALIAAIYARHGKLIYLISYILVGAVSVIFFAGNGLHVELLYENFTASVIFLVLPNSILNHIGAILSVPQSGTGESGLRRYTAKRIRQMATAFEELYTTVDATISRKSNDEDYSQVFDRASELVCRTCKNKNECWNGCFMDTLSVFNDAGELIRSKGILRKEDLPEHFRDRCLKPDELVIAVNGELRGQIYRRQYSLRLQEKTSAAYGQYIDLAEILSGVSDELVNAYGPDPLAQRRLRRYLSSMDVEAEIAVFRDRGGRLHILLESVKLKRLLDEPGYLDRLSDAVGVRLCRPIGSDANAEGRITLLEAEPLSVSVGVASMKKTGESISGDRGTYFKTDQGVLCILLSDGIGSGENAAKESVAAIRILERFLRTGIDPALAMKMLNSVMLLKNNDSWGFATVDLLCIDLFTGTAAFYKYGAAPSFVRSGKQIRRIRSESMAAGLGNGEDGLPDVVKLRLHPGCLALIASDGVVADQNDEWIRHLLSQSDGKSMKHLARDMLKTALKQYGCNDDMTVLAIRVDQRQ